MIKLGVTGNIASGKTLVEKYLKEQGVTTVDSDQIVHNLLKNDIGVKEQVFDLFKGFDIKDERGEISRLKVGKIVFKDKDMLKKLENILHPAVKIAINQFFEKYKNKDVAAAVVPLLFEAKMENIFDRILLVTADLNTRIKRLMARNNFTYEEAMDRINSQMPQEEKIKKADFTIDNSSTPEKTKSQIIDVLNKLKN